MNSLINKSFNVSKVSIKNLNTTSSSNFTENISFWGALTTSFPFVILGSLSFGAVKGINWGLTYWLPDFLENDLEVKDF